MGNIKKEQINKRYVNGIDDKDLVEIEDWSINEASTKTDELLSKYENMPNSREGKYVNSDLMKMIFEFYAYDQKNREKYNLAVTNTAAVLANEEYIRMIKKEETKKCIFIAGPYGAGKSYFAQSLFENDETGEMKDAIVYEGSITPPAFDEKIQLAIDNGVTPSIIALNPTLELSMRNIKKRAKETGRDVIKEEVLDKFSNFYIYMKRIKEKFSDMTCTIYNKEHNVLLDIKNSINDDVEQLYHGKPEEIEKQYDKIIAKLENEQEK